MKRIKNSEEIPFFNFKKNLDFSIFLYFFLTCRIRCLSESERSSRITELITVIFLIPV